MTDAGPEIWLGDLIRARAQLGGERGSDTLVAHILLRAGLDQERGENPNELPEFRYAAAPEDDEPFDSGADGDESAGTEEEFGDIVATFPELSPIRTDPVPLTNWQLVSTFPAVTQSQLDLRPPLTPLLSPGTTPAILQALLQAQAMDGEPDVARMVEHVARGLPLTRIIRRPRPTMRFGTQVLLDTGESMEPFARDQRELVARIKDVVGADGVEPVSFADAPLRGVRRGRARAREPYRPPPPGTRVLVVSDLGIGGRALNPMRAGAEEWLDFVETVERAQCRAVALVPFPPTRIPTSLAVRLPVITWDRSTDVRRAAMAAAR
jgi:hypothetical protein